MRKDLFEDLYTLEEQHWWHIAKRRAVINSIQRYTKNNKLKILDIGCGTGKHLEQLKQYGHTYGLDSSLEAIEFCRKRGLRNIKQGKAENLPFKPNFFDIITLLDVLEHTNDNITLQEVYGALRKNGLLILTVPAFTWLWSDWDKVLHHKRRYNKNNLAAILTKHNFTIIYSTYLYSFLVLPALIIRQIKQLLMPTKEYSSDFSLSNDFLNKIMDFISKIEFKIAQTIPIPFGTTVLVVAKK